MTESQQPQLPWKVPPREKIHEGISAVLDGRVEITSSNSAYVTSSDRSKKYTITWTDDRTAFGANDNASFYQGYIGYPIVAVLLKLGLLPFDASTSRPLAGVQWKAINKKHKNNYAAAVDEVLLERLPDATARQAVDNYIEGLYRDLVALKLERLKPVARPPG